MMVIELKVPPVGESIREVQIAHWRKGVGEHFDRDEQLVELETDKATVELPAPDAGVLAKILKQEGEIVAVGEVIAHLQADADGPRGAGAKEAKSEQPASKPTPPKSAAPSAPTEESAPAGENDTGDEREPWAVPSARRALHKYGLKPADVEPSGRGGRLTESDVEGFARERQLTDNKTVPPAPAPQPVAEKKAAPTTIVEARPSTEVTDDEERIVPMSIIRRRIAERLVEAQHQAALLTTYNEVDMSAVIDARKRYQEQFEKKYQVKLGFMSFFVKATIDALRQFPALNAEVRGTNIVYRDAYHIGVAIGSGKGLVVPVLHHAERMSFAEIEQQIRDYAERANQGKIRPQDLERGTFTISNGGVYGSMLSTPIVNPPQSGVLGMHAIQQRPVARDNQVVIRPIMYVALTYDHRLVDGREAVTFLKRIQEAIEDPARMLLEI